MTIRLTFSKIHSYQYETEAKKRLQKGFHISTSGHKLCTDAAYRLILARCIIIRLCGNALC